MLKIKILMIAVLMCLFGGCSQTTGSVAHLSASAATRTERGEVVRVLILGKDRAVGLTDGILIASFDTSSRDLRVLQIPRDTYAEYSQRDYMKLNGAYNVLGMNGVKTFLSEALGVRLDYALVLDLDCVADLVDAVGGVEVEVTQTMQYKDIGQDLVIDLVPGVHRLDGKAAEHFLRFRSGYANADLGRLDAQKRFIGALLKQCSGLNSASLTQLMLRVLPKSETDIPIHQAIRLGRLLPEIRAEDVPMITAPGEPVLGVSGAWYYSLNRAGMIRVIREYLMAEDFADQLFDPNGKFDRSENPDFHNIYIAPDRGA